MTGYWTRLTTLTRSATLTLPILVLFGLSSQGLSQIQPAVIPATVEETQAETASRTVQALHPVIPSLPPLGEATRYLPEEQTIHLLLKLSQRKVYVYQGKTVLASYPVAIGRAEFPTPTGEFQVFEMIVNPAWQSPWTGEVETPGADGSLGLRWIGFTKVTGGVIGFHGTPNVRSIGQAVSHGCVRMRNEDIVKMYSQVKLGTLVRVEQ